MTFALPQMLWLLLIVVPALVFFLWWSWRKRQELIAQFISSRLASVLKVGVSANRQITRMVIFVAAIICVILALARPQWGVTKEEARQRGLDIIVAIDTSNSMLAEDIAPNRLARAKLAAIDLMRQARTDRLGLIAFAGSAFLQCPLTLDDAAFSQSVDSLDTRTISQGGTAVAEAIQEARRTFKNDGDNHKAMVIFSDGEDHEGEAEEEAEKAAKEGIVIFTIGVGTPEGEFLRVRDERGRVDFFKDDQGNKVKSQLKEDLLREIARLTKGFYLPLRGTTVMNTLYEKGIALLPKSENAVRMFQHLREQFQWPLGAAIGLLILEVFLPDRKGRSGRVKKSPVAVAGTAAMLVMLFTTLNARAGTGTGSAFKEYEQGKFADALRDYNQLLEQKKDDPRLHFNAGAAAYQSHELEQAVKQFNEALASPDLQLQQRAYYNLGNTLFRQGQQATDDSKKQESWENAVKNYESALKLNQQDPDAKFNQEFVKKRIEELKKQQSQSQKDQQKKSDKDQKDQKDQQKQSPGESQKQDPKDQKDQQDQQKQDQQSQDSKNNGQKQDQKDQKDGQQPDKDKDKDKGKGKDDKSKQSEKKDPSQAKPAGKPEDKSKEEAEQEAAAMAAGEMTPKQAQQLLDAQKGEDQVLRLVPPTKPARSDKPFKNW